MLESATVTLSYKEFKDLVDKAELAEEKEKIIDKLIEEREEGKPIKALDTIIDFLSNAFDAKAKDKQEYIKKAIECYCNTFGIPVKEFVKIEE